MRDQKSEIRNQKIAKLRPNVVRVGPCNEPQFDNYLQRKIQNKQKDTKLVSFIFCLESKK